MRPKPQYCPPHSTTRLAYPALHNMSKETYELSQETYSCVKGDLYCVKSRGTVLHAAQHVEQDSLSISCTTKRRIMCQKRPVNCQKRRSCVTRDL